MAEVKRYDCETETRNSGYMSYEVAVMEEWPDGDWVKYEDYEAVESRCKELELELAKNETTFAKLETLLERFVATLSPADQRRIRKARTALMEAGDER